VRRPASVATVAGVLALVYVLWGSTSPAMKIAVSSVPPFWMAAIRFTCAGGILWGWCRARGVALPRASEWRWAGLTGIVLLVVGNATYAWTLQYLPSGAGSLVFALSPLWMALFAFAMHRERLSALAGAGIVLGLAGMVFLFSPAGGQGFPLWPAVIALGTSLAWGFGSILQRRLRGSDLVQTSAMQMLVAAAALVLLALVFREPLKTSEFVPSAVGAIAYLVVLGSLVGFSAYLWLLNNVPTTLASTYAYVNPVVALAIGIGLLHEPFSLRLVIGATVIVVGVALMVVAPKR
jgi:drug/metabolite transporter (DMT)-like permease